MSILKRVGLVKLFVLILVVGLACSTAQATVAPTQVPPREPTQSPSPTPTLTPIPEVRIPDDGRVLFEAWRVIMQDFVENSDINYRLLSDGAILGILEASEQKDVSLSQARDLIVKLDNADSFFRDSGGSELKEAYEVWAFTYDNFVQDGALTVDQLNEAAIEGMIEALGDPYTSFLTEEEIRLDQEALRGSFEGIGAYVDTAEDGSVLVVAPIKDTPAEAAGIRAGDLILEVNGEPTNKMSLQEAIRKIKGPRGTPVELLVKHLLDPEPELINVVRSEIHPESVRSRMETDDVALIRIELFTQRTPSELASALQEVKESGAKALILDIRQNPGGLLAETVQVADEFLDDGLVLFEEDSDGRRVDWDARPGGLAVDIPMAVLVDRFSASGAEVLAGAIQDHGRAPLIGTQTFGKGSVTHLRGLSDGSGLYVTFARWFTPQGRLIEGLGIEPDVEVTFTEADLAAQRDPQLEEALRYLEEIVGKGA